MHPDLPALYLYDDSLQRDYRILIKKKQMDAVRDIYLLTGIEVVLPQDLLEYWFQKLARSSTHDGIYLLGLVCYGSRNLFEILERANVLEPGSYLSTVIDPPYTPPIIPTGTLRCPLCSSGCANCLYRGYVVQNEWVTQAA